MSHIKGGELTLDIFSTLVALTPRFLRVQFIHQSLKAANQPHPLITKCARSTLYLLMIRSPYPLTLALKAKDGETTGWGGMVSPD